MVLKIFDYVKGDTATSYENGRQCLEKILEIVDECETIQLDFSGVEFVITAFLNPVIGDLILEKGASVMKKISIENANENTIQKIKMVKEGALLRREDLDE